MVGEVEELEHGRIALVEAVGPDQCLSIAVRGADHQEGASLGDHAAEERKVWCVVGELVLEGQLGAGFFVGGKQNQAPPLVFELRIGAPCIRVGQDAQLA